MEGVAFSLKDCMETLGVDSRIKNPIPLGGGIANSVVWCRIIADVLQHPIIQLKNNETETLGDMIIAGLSIHENGITREFGRVLSGQGNIIWPDSSNRRVYEEQFKKYKDIYENTKRLYWN